MDTETLFLMVCYFFPIFTGIRLGLAMTHAPLTNDKKAASCALGDLLEQVVRLVILAHILSHLVKGKPQVYFLNH